MLAFGNPERSASTIYRVVQYREILAAGGVELEFVERKDLDSSVLERVAAADVVLNQKCVINRLLGARIRKRAKRLLFDYDDPMWTRPGKKDFRTLIKWRTEGRLQWWLRNADGVMAANEYLANYARPHARRLDVLPMALDLDVWRPQPPAPRAEVVVGWAGSPVMLRLVERLEPVLREALKRAPNLRFAVYCGRRPAWSIPFTHVPFSPGTEAAFVQGLDVGLLPMEDTEMDRARSPIKSLQYLSCGVPVVGSLVGASKEIVDESNGIAVSGDAGWVDAIVALAGDAARRRRLGAAGLARVRERHDLKRVGQRLLEILREPAAARPGAAAAPQQTVRRTRTSMQPRLIISAGMPRSGSTWLYNAARLLLAGTVPDPAQFSYGWVRDMKDRPATPLQLVKVHAFDRRLARRASVILYSFRDIRDAVASRARMTGEPQLAGEADHYVKHDRRWRPVANYVMRYETMRADPAAALRQLADALGIPGADLGRLREELEQVERAESGRASGYDRENLLHAHHITHGGHGTWTGSLAPELVAEIETRHHRWLLANGYPITAGPATPWGRMRWLWWSMFG